MLPELVFPQVIHLPSSVQTQKRRIAEAFVKPEAAPMSGLPPDTALQACQTSSGLYHIAH